MAAMASFSVMPPVATSSSPAVAPSLTSNKDSLAIDLGESQIIAIKAMVQARRQRRSNSKVETETGFLSRASSLFGKSAQTLPQLLDRRTPLSKLARQGVIPADIVQEPSMNFKRLANSYSVRDMVDFGMTWAHLKQLGFDVCDLHSMKMDEYHLLGVRADNLCEDLPVSAGDLVTLFQGRPHQLRELGFTFSHFVNLGMTHDQLRVMVPNPRDVDTYFAPTSAQRASMPSGVPGDTTARSSTRAARSFRRKGELAF